MVGVCRFDQNAMAFCECPDHFGGTFCELLKETDESIENSNTNLSDEATSVEATTVKPEVALNEIFPEKERSPLRSFSILWVLFIAVVGAVIWLFT